MTKENRDRKNRAIALCEAAQTIHKAFTHRTHKKLTQVTNAIKNGQPEKALHLLAGADPTLTDTFEIKNELYLTHALQTILCRVQDALEAIR